MKVRSVSSVLVSELHFPQTTCQTGAVMLSVAAFLTLTFLSPSSSSRTFQALRAPKGDEERGGTRRRQAKETRRHVDTMKSSLCHVN